MPLTAEDDHVPLLGLGHRPGNGLAAVLDDHVGVAGLLDLPEDVGDDLVGVLGPGVVGGDDRQVRQAHTGPAHDGPLGGVPVPAAAEDRDEPSGAEAPGGPASLE